MHFQLRNLFAACLDRGEWASGARIPGERELAAQFGVSALTANKAVTALVDEGRLERRRGLGTYVAGADAGSNVFNLGVVLHRSLADPEADAYAGEILAGIQLALLPLGRSWRTSYLTEWSPREWAALSRSQLGGLILIAPPSDRWHDIDRLCHAGLRVVAIGASWSGTEADIVDVDNAGAMRWVVEHLLALGHRRIACAVARVNFSNHRERVKEFWTIMKERGVPVQPGHLIERWMPDDDLSRADIRSLLESPLRPSAIVTLDWPTASSLLEEAGRLGLRIPDDLSIVTFDAPEDSGGEKVTSIVQPLREMGRRALEMMRARRGGERLETSRCILPATLIERGSTAALNVFPGKGMNP